MAKKENYKTRIISKLIIEKDVFIKKIEERIIKGKDLLKQPVTVVSTHTGYFGEPYNKYEINEQRNFLSEYKKWKQFNIELLKRSFNIPNNEYLMEYEKAENKVWNDLIKVTKHNIKNQITVLESIIERLPLISDEKHTKEKENPEFNEKISNKIFIVHGHNNEIIQTLARTLTQLKLEPIILHEQIEQGRTIIEKFEDEISNINFAIILLTADDIGKAKKDSSYKNRARQNVIFEMGYLIGKLGRKNVFLLLENDVEKPGDLDGIVYVPIDNLNSWKLKLVKELKAANYNVTADNL